MVYPIYTIGHSNLSEEQFISLLKKHNITALADVRSYPYSKYLPHFNQKNLKIALKKVGIAYVFLGEELGARPKNHDCYVDGKAIYEKIAATELFTEGIERILKGIETYKIALMCAEKDPITCHRAVLVCQNLRQYKLEINHILNDGSLETHEHLEERLLKIHGHQNRENLQQFNLFEKNVALEVNQEKELEEAYHKQGLKIAYVEK